MYTYSKFSILLTMFLSLNIYFEDPKYRTSSFRLCAESFNFCRDFDERIKVEVMLLIYQFIILLTPKISRRNTSFTRWWKLEVNWWYVCVCGSSCVRNGASFIIYSHKLNMELDLQSLFGLHMHSCNYWLRPRNPLPPHLGSYTRALLVSQDGRHLFVTPCLQLKWSIQITYPTS